MADLVFDVVPDPTTFEVFSVSKFDGDKAYNIEFEFSNCQANIAIVE